jgi:TRAP-type mannitol/chloroaromatic compound transport system permease small subunit
VTGLLKSQRDRKVAAYLIGLLVSASLALVVVLVALDMQSERVLDAEGLSWSLAALFGPAVFLGQSTQGWRVVGTAGSLADRDRFVSLFNTHIALDFAFIVVYALLGLVIVLFAKRPWWRWLAGIGLAALVVVDLLENFLALAVFGGNANLIPVLVVLTKIKWLLVAALLIIAVIGLVVRAPEKYVSKAPDKSEERRRSPLGRAWNAILVQRFSLLPSLVFFVLSVTSGAAILEQLPDVERAWVDSGVGRFRAVAALVATLIVALSVFITTRLRIGFVRKFSKPGQPYPAATLGYWAIGPAVVVVFAVLALLVGRTGATWPDALSAQPGSSGELHTLRTVVFVGVPLLAIIGVSLLLRRIWTKHPERARKAHPPEFYDQDVASVTIVGDIATAAVVVVAGLGLLRAFAPVLILRGQLVQVDIVWVWVCVGTGLILIGLPWLIMIITTVLRVPPTLRIAFWDPVRTGVSLLVVWILIFFVLGLVPTLAARLGLAATAVLGIGSLTGMVSAMGLIVQPHAPAEAFRLLGFKRTPVVTVLAVIVVLVIVLSGKGTIHEVDRGSAAGPVDGRKTMADAFHAWSADPEGCEFTVGKHRVRPMLLVAAEGGGIRAAYWTVRGLEAIGEKTCAGRSVLFSAGASGGSVGLTVARFSGTATDPGITRAVEAIQQMAGPGTLSEAADGTFIRDTFYGATGVPMPLFPPRTRAWDWTDRARLIESGWKDAYQRPGQAWGDRSFLNDQDLSPATGHLILNSTDAKHVCRVWVSQIKPDPSAMIITSPGDSFDPENSCDKVPGPATRTVDLFTAYGPHAPEASGHLGHFCLGDIQAATAALLTARFPFVTPGAVIGPCPDRVKVDQRTPAYWPRTQLVDGGYVENSGLATITDLAPQWLPLVRDHNLQAANPANDLPFIVPFVVYLANGDQDTAHPELDQGPTSEVALPLRTYLRGGVSLSKPAALLERARDLVKLHSFCQAPGNVAGLADACGALETALPRRVIVIDRLPQPEVAAPLGWSLSQSSRSALNAAIDAQVKARCDGRSSLPSCRLGYAPLGELRHYYGVE